MQGAVETEKKWVIKYVTKTVRLLRSALSDIKQGEVTEMSEERELFHINGQERISQEKAFELTPEWQ